MKKKKTKRTSKSKKNLSAKKAKKSKVPESMRAPGHLQNGTREWWESVNRDFNLEPHQIKLLTLAGESWDRCAQARRAVLKHGLTSTNRYGEIRARPEINIERDNRIAFARLLRELNLDSGDDLIDIRPPPLKFGGK